MLIRLIDATQQFFCSLSQFRVAHGVTAVGRRIYVMGGSAKANADFGPGLNQLEVLSFDEEGGVEQKWEIEGEMNERRSVDQEMNDTYPKWWS